MEEAPAFFRLGPEAALEAAETHGFVTTGRCGVLRCLENRVYDVELESGGHVVIKFYRPGRWTRAALLDEHQFLRDLQAAEVPVCAPLVDPDGGTLGEYRGIFFGVWERTGGREPDELGRDELVVVGRLLARVHAVGATREAPDRPELDGDYGIRQHLDPIGDAISHGVAGRFRDAALRLADCLDERLDETEVPFLRIHGDCHRGNLLRGVDSHFFLDFDDVVEGPAVHDLWVLAPERGRVGAEMRDRMLVGYRQFFDFDSAWWRLVEPLRATRYVEKARWILRRWDESTFRSTFPHFGTEVFWEGETRDLEEQWRTVQNEAHG
jgi:Ser/Thr protein kinase RdoA (MazF antagonist)